MSTRPASYHLQPPIHHLAASSTHIFHSPASFSLVSGPDDRWETQVVLSTASSSVEFHSSAASGHTAAAIASVPSARGWPWPCLAGYAAARTFVERSHTDHCVQQLCKMPRLGFPWIFVWYHDRRKILCRQNSFGTVYALLSNRGRYEGELTNSSI